jgi:hypothetical protein
MVEVHINYTVKLASSFPWIRSSVILSASSHRSREEVHIFSMRKFSFILSGSVVCQHIRSRLWWPFCNFLREWFAPDLVAWHFLPYVQHGFFLLHCVNTSYTEIIAINYVFSYDIRRCNISSRFIDCAFPLFVLFCCMRPLSSVLFYFWEYIGVHYYPYVALCSYM